ncbi:MAG: long-chain-fatty-acid--CoA ligase [Gammaproteobacteria bacterium]|jgi:acyl-CoA synthetase (AMP-forming)/AMP-acid ligase II|nr:long-chain-fatty-acid--CoA ligase [Gammaproteobacteria bacterium]
MSSEINIGDLLTTRTFLNPNKEALYDDYAGLRMTYRDLNERANRCGNGLFDLGLRRGDRVALLAQNGHQFAENFFGPTKIGMVMMPLNWRLTAQELAFILKDGGATAIVFDAEFAPVIDEIRGMGAAGSDLEHFICIGENAPDYATSYEAMLQASSTEEPTEKAGPDDNLFIMYTSGTTGHPKGVVHTHTTVMWGLLTFNATADTHFSDRYLLMMPMFHVGALTPLISSTYLGTTLVLLRSFDPVHTWKTIEAERITTTLAVPAMLNFMLQVPDYEKYDWSSVRYVASGAAPVPPSLIKTYMEMGIQINQIYGMTETCGPACMIGPDDAVSKIGSTGKAFFHTGVRIVDSQGNDQPPGEPGEVLVKGPHIMKEYWNRPEATAEAIVDGWLYTGDIATWDEDKFVTIQDRMKDMIISGGENIYPAEVENILLQHPEISDVAVIGQPSARWGESPVAVIVSENPELSIADITQHCEGKLARFKIPKGIERIDIIPRNPSGKILKRILRDEFPGPAPE